MEYLKNFVLSAAAGLMISIGGMVFISNDNKVAGALLFTLGLYTICIFGLNLFTGKAGYLVTSEDKAKYIGFLATVWLGNLLGTFVGAKAILLTRINIREKANAICEAKLCDASLSLFILAVFCGLLMYIAVDGYKKTTNPTILFVCVSGFILAGFEHSVADMFYLFASDASLPAAFRVIIIATFGNLLGGCLIPAINLLK